jgi:signal transduction histidine kinase
MDDFFHRVFDTVPGYVSVQDRSLRIVAANAAFRRDFGDGVGKLCYAVYKGRSVPCPVCPVEATFADGRIRRSEEMVSVRSGESKHVMVYAAPLLNAASEVEAVVELSADITEVKQLQERFRMLFEEVPCYISVQGRDLRIREINKRFRADFGEGIGEHCYRVYKHRTEPCLTCPVAQTFDDGSTHTSEEIVTAIDGGQVNVLCSTAPLVDASGEIQAVMEMSANITELRQVQTQLASLGMLVGSVAHGVKGLLSGLDGGVYLMETGFAKGNTERLEQGRDMIKRNVDRIRAMVLNLLHYAKDRELYFQPVDIQEILSSVGNVMASRAQQMGVTISTQAEPGAFSADHDAFHSVLINLIENAIDACRVDKTKTQGHVNVSARVEDGNAIFEIEDNGVGMDQETREKAFSVFFSSKGAEGTGLGLFIANKIVSAHDGRIAIESTPGQGTRFLVVVPADREGRGT